ncbi:MAG: hypothetical protein QXS85_04635 [Acidilobaceae archaeon]
MLKIDAQTKLFGILGDRISYTLSPAIHNLVFSKTGFNAVYLVFDVPRDRFQQAIEGLLALAEGFNVTTPYKEQVVLYLRGLDVSAEKVGAVNTVHRGVGYNTDYMAVKQLVWEAVGRLAGGECLVAGAGGAAKASALALAELGCTVRVLNRTRARAEELVARLNTLALNATVEDRCERVYDVLVNATPDPEWVLRQGCEARELALDLVYRPVVTKLIARALERGARVVTGLHVLIRQALLAQSIWQSRDLGYLEEEVRDYLCLEILSGECLE